MKSQITEQLIDAVSLEETTNVASLTSGRAFSRRFGVAVLQFATIVLAASFASAQGGPKVIKGSTPGLVRQAQDLGPEDPDKQITVTVVLQQHNQAAFQQTLQQIYTKGSPLYHQWLTMDQYADNFAPSAAEAAMVRDFLTSHDLNVTKTDKFNAYVIAEGTVGEAQSAFQVPIDRFSVHEKTYRANTKDVTVEGPAGPLVAAVLGLDDVNAEPSIRRPVNQATGQPIPGIPVDEVTPTTFTNSCFGSSREFQFDSWTYWPYITYTGQTYQLDTNTTCAYTPGQVQSAYGLTDMDLDGNTANNQAIGIVVAYGSPTIIADENYFAGYFRLPNPSMIVNLSGTVQSDETWATETTMDVEYASAMAPGASVYLWVASDTSGLLTSLSDAVTESGVNQSTGTCLENINGVCAKQISNSWAYPERSVSSGTLQFTDQIAMEAAGFGISLNFASGDCGDYSTYVPGSDCSGGAVAVSSPAGDPWVTAVGGTTLALNSNNSILFQSGWGNNLTQIAAGTIALLPPSRQGFQQGAGGGYSAVYKTTVWEQGCFTNVSCWLPNKNKPRKLPDVAFLADMNTGVQVIQTDTNTGQFLIEVGGGTSLSTPMFTGLWAIANEYYAQKVVNNPSASLGLAAPYLYWAQKYYPSAITDIQASSYSNRQTYNVTGCEHRWLQRGCHPSYSVSYLVDFPGGSYVSAVWQGAPQNWGILSFGTDSSLATAPGWDDVTGVGVPNGLQFLLGINKY